MSITQSLRRLRGIRAEEISVSLPFGLGGIKIKPNRAEQRAAWALYVELTTRIAIQPFDPDHGSMREVLSSLYSLFALTREVLREAGPEVAHGPESFGPLAIEILTKGIAKFTTKWHQKLHAYELARPDGVSALQHERAWDQFETMRRELGELQQEMKRYASLLAAIAGARV